MNETTKDAAQSSADDRAYARLEKDVAAVKNDVSHLSQQISETVNALGAVAQSQARRGLRNARADVNSVMSGASERGQAVANAAHDAASSVGDALADVIQERPAATLALALGLGFLIGVIWRRQSKALASYFWTETDQIAREIMAARRTAGGAVLDQSTFIFGLIVNQPPLSEPKAPCEVNFDDETPECSATEKPNGRVRDDEAEQQGEVTLHARVNVTR